MKIPAKNENGNSRFAKPKKENPTDFNTENNTTIPGFKTGKIENCTKIDDVKLYKEKYKQKK